MSVDLLQSRQTNSRVLDGIDRVADEVVSADRYTVGGHPSAIFSRESLVGSLARECRRYIVDVAAAPVVIDHSANRQRIRDQRQIEGRIDIAVRIPVRGVAVARIDDAFGYIELRVIGDVTQDPRLGACPE